LRHRHAGRDAPLDRNQPEITAADLPISEIVSTYSTTFAPHGDPNGPRLPVWPEFIDSDCRVMYFKNLAFPGPVPSAGSLDVLDACFAWRRTAEGEAWAK
jgi:para-nitrobenzyl esterase